MHEINVWFLKISALWCILNKHNKPKYVIYMVCVILTCHVLFLPGELLRLISFYENFDSTMEILGFVIIHSTNSLKILNLYVNREEILSLVDDLFGHNLTPQTGKDCKNLQDEFHRKAYRVCMTFFQMGNGAIVIRALMSFIHLVYCKIDTKYKELCSTVQPLLIYIPVDVDVSYFQWIMCGFQSICLAFHGWQIVAHDMLLVNALIKINCNIHLLQKNFQTITGRCLLKQTDQANLSDSKCVCLMNLEMNRSTKNLQDLIRSCERVSSIFMYPILLQVMSTLIILMTSLYVAASVPVFSGTFIFQTHFYLTIALQLSMYCWFANEVTTSFSQVPQAIYQNNWIIGDQSFKRSMLINMIRMNKPIYFMIGTITPLNLNILVYVLRASYSYFAIIKNK